MGANTPPAAICLRVAFGQRFICLRWAVWVRSAGDGDGVITFYLVEKGVDHADNYALVRRLSD